MRYTALHRSERESSVRLGEQHRPLRFLVVDELRERILSGEISPGVRLVEDHIAAELGVSRSPVREALRALETEGLVELSPRRGVFVAAVSQEDAVQIFEAREALESFAARLAARNTQLQMSCSRCKSCWPPPREHSPRAIQSKSQHLIPSSMLSYAA